MKSTLNYSNAINMLTLWATPKMWHDKSLYTEIIAITDKLSNTSLQLSERELYVTQELTNGLIESTLNSMNKADDFEYDELSKVFTELTQFKLFLLTNVPAH